MDMHFEVVDLEKVLDIIVAFNSERDSLKLLDIILTKMRDIANCEAGTLYEVRDDQLHFAIMHNEMLNIYQQGEEIKLPPVSLDESNIENVSAYCAINDTVVNIEDVYDSTEFNFQGPKNYDALTGFRTQSMIVFPLPDLHGNVIGVIQLINARDASGAIIAFDKRLEFAFRSLANIAASALANMLYIAEISGLFYSFVSVMSQAIDERTPYNVNHTWHTAEYARNFSHYLRDRFPAGSKFHISEAREEQLYMAALLHDIGKVVTPLDIMDKESRMATRLPLIRHRFAIKKLQEEVAYLTGGLSEEEYCAANELLDRQLAFVERIDTAPFVSDEDMETIRALGELTYNDAQGSPVPLFEAYDMECLSIRKGTLTDAERESMQDHVVVTGRLLDNISFNKQYEHVPDWAKKHHEFLDGSGYPEGLRQDEIPLEARIITIMDIYDSLTAIDRPYRRSLSREETLKILLSMADEGKLDGELVRFLDESGLGPRSGADAE